MTEVLNALGWEASAYGKLRWMVLVTLVTLGALAFGIALAKLEWASPVAIQALIWVVWLGWLGVVFPRNAWRDATAPCALPYRRAFTREILVGIAVAFSQFLRPVVSGTLADGAEVGSWWPNIVIGAPLFVLGVMLIVMGVSTLGIARTLFVHEYHNSVSGLAINGIYRLVRHPLFLGGSLVSLGLAICTDERVAVELALVNACVLPAYVRLEDRRCCKVLGQSYVRYRSIVGGVLPRRLWEIVSAARWRKVVGSMRPIKERSLVKRR